MTIFQKYQNALNYTSRKGHEQFINSLINTYKYVQSASGKFTDFDNDIMIMSKIKKLFTEKIEDEKKLNKRIKDILGIKGLDAFCTIQMIQMEYLRKAYFDKEDFTKIEDNITHIEEIRDVLRLGLPTSKQKKTKEIYT